MAGDAVVSIPPSVGQPLRDLTPWSSTRWPHTLRDVPGDAIGLAAHRLRVIVPDVGGGFGVKQEVSSEELALALPAMRLGDP
jgi:carbon-monoxide dehydrogenase large subunit